MKLQNLHGYIHVTFGMLAFRFAHWHDNWFIGWFIQFNMKLFVCLCEKNVLLNIEYGHINKFVEIFFKKIQSWRNPVSQFYQWIKSSIFTRFVDCDAVLFFMKYINACSMENIWKFHAKSSQSRRSSRASSVETRW